MSESAEGAGASATSRGRRSKIDGAFSTGGGASCCTGSTNRDDDADAAFDGVPLTPAVRPDGGNGMWLLLPLSAVSRSGLAVCVDGGSKVVGGMTGAPLT